MTGSKARKVLKLEAGRSPDEVIKAFAKGGKKSLEYNFAGAKEVDADLMPGAFLENEKFDPKVYIIYTCIIHIYINTHVCMHTYINVCV